MTAADLVLNLVLVVGALLATAFVLVVVAGLVRLVAPAARLAVGWPVVIADGLAGSHGTRRW